MIGFLWIIRLIDRIMKKGTGKLLFLAAELVKMGVITGSFLLLARRSDGAALSYFLGISVVVAAILMEGLYQLYGSFRHGA